ncbi:MAG: hypothetical protein KJ017_11415 [Alphaproteobacteria bacterium]|nr:hypothetical protein [Alphaproteobacteria bacterium]
MTTYRTSLLTEITDPDMPLSEGAKAYFRERQRNKLFDVIVGCFLKKEKLGKLTRAELARRLGKRPEQITRWLSTPGNWTLDTISDLTLAICNGELNFDVYEINDQQARRNSDSLTTFRYTHTYDSTKPISHTASSAAQHASLSYHVETNNGQ